MENNSESRERILKSSKEDFIDNSNEINDLESKYKVNDLRPKQFLDYVGQESVVESIAIAVSAAKERGDPLDHSLFHGPPGLGKTTIAHIISREVGSQLIHTSGPALDRPADVVGLLSNLNNSDILFIDEIHRLSNSVEEYLYSAMEDFRVDFVTGSGAFAKTINLPLLPFTLIGSTTRVGMLSAPLRERFGLSYHLDYYSIEELSKVITRSSGILGLEIDKFSAEEIAKRSRGTPRIANRLLRRVRDYCQVKNYGNLQIDIVTEALDKEGVDSLGLDRLDRLYLNTLFNNYQGGPAGIQALSATVNEDQQTLEDVVEASKAVGAHDFIMNLPHTYDTLLEQRGSNISLGQRQLLSFARAIVADTKILILDEATASIDSYTEMLIQRALAKLLQNRTGMVIAHRLATIRGADRIIVLQDGKIIETGNHDELVSLGGLYSKMYSLNYSSFDDIPDELIKSASMELDEETT